MMSYFELWDTNSRNLLDESDTEAEALAFVRELLEVDGSYYAEHLALGLVGESGEHQIIARAEELVERARLAALAA